MPSLTAGDITLYVLWCMLKLCLFLLEPFLQIQLFFAKYRLSLATSAHNFFPVRTLDTFLSHKGLIPRYFWFTFAWPSSLLPWAWLGLVQVEVHVLGMAFEFVTLARIALAKESASFAGAPKDTSDDPDDESKAQKSDDSSDDADTSLDELKSKIQSYLPSASLAEEVAPTSALSAPTPAPAVQDTAGVTVPESTSFTGVPGSTWGDGDDSGYETDDEHGPNKELVIQEKKPVILQLQTCAPPPVPEFSQPMSFVVLGTGRLLGVSTVLLRGLSQKFTDMPLVRYAGPLLARHQMLLFMYLHITLILIRAEVTARFHDLEPPFARQPSPRKKAMLRARRNANPQDQCPLPTQQSTDVSPQQLVGVEDTSSHMDGVILTGDNKRRPEWSMQQFQADLRSNPGWSFSGVDITMGEAAPLEINSNKRVRRGVRNWRFSVARYCHGKTAIPSMSIRRQCALEKASQAAK